MRPLVLVTAPVATRSGYGSHSRDIVHSLIDMDKFDIKIMSVRWGNCSMNALDGHDDLLIIDDLLATGGTALAAVELIENFENKNIIGAGFIINLPDLNGDKKLKDKGINIHSLMEF